MKVGAAAQKLGLSMQTYANWVVRAREGKLERLKNSDTMDWWLKDKSDRVSL
jgi:transposase